MKKTVHKWFWAWNFDKEEKWLNDMAAKGFALVAVGMGSYTFEECAPGEYNIRLELLENLPTHTESEQYIKFLEETGVEYLGSIIRWVYFRKKREHGDFDLYSDINSRMMHLNRILVLLAILGIINLFNGIHNISLYFTQRITLASLIIGGICISIGLLLMYGVLKIHNKKQKLRKEKQVFES